MTRRALVPLLLALVAAPAAAGPVLLRTRGGPAEVRYAGRADWIAVYERGYLDDGDEVRTPKGTTAFIELGDGNVVALLPGARLTVEEARAGEAPSGETQVLFWRPTGTFRLFLHEGEAAPILDRFRGRTFTMGTPVATAGVRGTAFTAIVAPRDNGLFDAAFVVYRGEVEVTRPGAAPVVVPAGRFWWVEAAAPVGAFSTAATVEARVGSLNDLLGGEGEARAPARQDRFRGTHYARQSLETHRTASLSSPPSILRAALEPVLALRILFPTATEPTTTTATTLEPTTSTLETSILPVTSPIRETIRERLEAAPPDVRENLVDEIRSRFVRELCQQHPEQDVCRVETSN